MTINNIENTVNSSLWAAYGDALGFISELADCSLLVKRTGRDHLSGLIEWKRQVGGMYGPLVSIPSGAYSDDTQLRLSTSRAINQNNYFDINAFSKVELPIWSSYALGAGISSKLAAESLGKKNVTWYNNFYQSKKTSYVHSGGNGAAMRIQPHVWASRTPEIVDSFLLDIIKNSLTTHGHPRAIAGAVFHALCLSQVLKNKSIPSISDVRLFLRWINEIPNKIHSDINLNTAWAPLFESQTSTSLEEAYDEVYQELVHLLDIVEKWKAEENPSYNSLVKALNLKDKRTRGSGTLTAIAALAASYLHPDNLPLLMLDIVNELGTDTDSIATMVGALRGYIEGTRPPQELQDQSYLIYDAERLYTLSQGNECNSFAFPDVSEWNAPVSSLDFVGIQDGKIVFPPFGEIKPISEEFRSNGTDTYQYFYQWMISEFNQSFLLKRRNASTLKSFKSEPSSMESNNFSKRVDSSLSKQQQIEIPVDYRTQSKRPIESNPTIKSSELDIDKLTTEAIKSNFDEKLIGSQLLYISGVMGVNGAIAYSAIIAKAITSRKNRNNRNN
ncbi:ADP-ribosylglycohydrolase family protein [Dickeya oryzae]|uniref:ADP-ribosylglycohydrolase family protein n=1 Tax=Dickeya oryzae TaxID=1240404 RepID=A0AB39INE7_9GAMM|nr:ADP-ribosylglycohydrolase family protein [Dickeya oryzae]MCA6992282.1 ADP-ribosylglycohydrolase family protein [Dickeya oryzae]